ncbi:MAG: NYN domain-containing protein [Candidatus Zapsychrus exili]|nr:NYN domain-containing protein [Candidatus Zapsychrus exili]
MSLQFLLDGYNITNQMHFSAKDSLEDQRNNLVNFIRTKRPCGSTRNNVTIIFDGKSGISSRRETDIQVVFPSSISADDKIKKIVEESSLKKNIVVVTDDRDIQHYVSALGAKVMKVSEFLRSNKSLSKDRGKVQNNKEKSKNISKEVEFKINSELERIWLDE